MNKNTKVRVLNTNLNQWAIFTLEELINGDAVASLSDLDLDHVYVSTGQLDVNNEELFEDDIATHVSGSPALPHRIRYGYEGKGEFIGIDLNETDIERTFEGNRFDKIGDMVFSPETLTPDIPPA